jgi:hypothetical protein
MCGARRRSTGPEQVVERELLHAPVTEEEAVGAEASAPEEPEAPESPAVAQDAAVPSAGDEQG